MEIGKRLYKYYYLVGKITTIHLKEVFIMLHWSELADNNEVYKVLNHIAM